jgi:hypothetical protein
MSAGTSTNVAAIAAQAANTPPKVTLAAAPLASASATRSPTPSPTRTVFPSPTALASRSATTTVSVSRTRAPSALPSGASQSATPSTSPAPSASPAAIGVSLSLPAAPGAALLTLATLPLDVSSVLIGAVSGALGVAPSAVSIIGVSEVQSRRLAQDSAASAVMGFLRRLAATSGYTVSFAVTPAGAAASTILPGAATLSPSALATAVGTTLQASIAKGELTNALAATDVLSSALGVSRAVLNSPSMVQASAQFFTAPSPAAGAPVSNGGLTSAASADAAASNTPAIVGGVVGVSFGGCSLGRLCAPCRSLSHARTPCAHHFTHYTTLAGRRLPPPLLCRLLLL